MNQLATIENNINSLQQDFNKIACNEDKFNQEALFACQILRGNSFLQKIAYSNPQSLRDAVLNVATLDVSLNPAQKHAYLIPRKGVVCLDISYMGLAHLAVKSGSVEYMQARIVYEKDIFQVGDIGKAPIHNYSPFGNRGEIIGVYCVSKLLSGDHLVETMSIDDVYNIRDRSEAYKKKHGPWMTDSLEMIKKTVIKRAYKMLPSSNSVLMNKAIDYLNNSGEGIDFEKEEEERNEEIKKAVEDRRNQDREDRDLLESTIEEITKFSSIICKDYTVQEKVEFMKETLGVNQFSQLKNKGQIVLADILLQLSGEVRRINEKNQAKGATFILESAKKKPSR